MAGVDIITVMELLGHKDSRMTKQYSHPTPEHKLEAVTVLDQVTVKITKPQEKKIFDFTEIPSRQRMPG